MIAIVIDNEATAIKFLLSLLSISSSFLSRLVLTVSINLIEHKSKAIPIIIIKIYNNSKIFIVLPFSKHQIFPALCHHALCHPDHG